MANDLSGSSTDHTGGAPVFDAFPDAYARRLEEIKAVKTEDLETIALDIPTSTTKTFSALPKIRQLREGIVEKLAQFDLQQFDSIEDYARALFYAHSVSLAATYSPEDVKKLGDEVVARRETLLNDARSLAQHNLLDGERLKAFKKGNQSYSQNSAELLSLASMLRKAWSTIEGKTPLQLADLSRAEELSTQLVLSQGQQKQSNAATAEAALRRQQAYTLFINAYDRARQAAVFLRWDQEDDQLFVPSLYSGRRGKPRRKDEPKDDPQDEPKETPASPSSAEPANQPPVQAAPAAHAAAPGQPGSKPFIK